MYEIDPKRLENMVGLSLLEREHSYLEAPSNSADRAAIMWLRHMDNAFRRRSGENAPPVWLYEYFKWGPHDWPVKWRDITEMPYHDCGLMAALSTEVYRFRGNVALPVQLVLYFNETSTRGWSGVWRKHGLTPHWCNGNFAYHEGTAVLIDNRFHIWDALGRFWLPVRNEFSYEAIVALRFIRDERIINNPWYCIKQTT